MERVKLKPEQVAMIDRRIEGQLKSVMRPADFEKALRDIYFQGFADAHDAMNGRNHE